MSTSRTHATRIAASIIASIITLSTASGCRITDTLPTIGRTSASAAQTQTQTVRLGDDADRLLPTETIYCTHIAGQAPIAPTGADAAEFEAYWNVRRHYEASASLTANGPIAKAWTVVSDFTRNITTPALEAHAFDAASLPAAPAEVIAAMGQVVAYDHDVCGEAAG